MYDCVGIKEDRAHQPVRGIQFWLVGNFFQAAKLNTKYTGHFLSSARSRPDTEVP